MDAYYMPICGLILCVADCPCRPHGDADNHAADGEHSCLLQPSGRGILRGQQPGHSHPHGDPNGATLCLRAGAGSSAAPWNCTGHNAGRCTHVSCRSHPPGMFLQQTTCSHACASDNSYAVSTISTNRSLVVYLQSDILMAEWRNHVFRPCHFLAVDRAHRCTCFTVMCDLGVQSCKQSEGDSRLAPSACLVVCSLCAA